MKRSKPKLNLNRRTDKLKTKTFHTNWGKYKLKGFWSGALWYVVPLNKRGPRQKKWKVGTGKTYDLAFLECKKLNRLQK